MANTNPFTEGAAVRQIVKVITGTVVDAKYDARQGEMSYLVEYLDADDEPAQRWFSDKELEANDE